MNLSFILLSGGDVASTGAAVGHLGISCVISIALVLTVFDILLVKPRKKKMKKREEMLKSMEVGDVVLTTSDIYGVLIDVTSEQVIVEVDSKCKCSLLMNKSAIAEVFKKDKTGVKQSEEKSDKA